jgi:hypothetical protein
MHKTKMNDQEKFVCRELIVLAWAASVQRSKLYDSKYGKPKDAINAFRSSLVDYFEKSLLKSYTTNCPEDQHIQNLEDFSNHGTQEGVNLLGPDGYKLGVAQKFLNLMLKYLWCIGKIPEPPHCPVDRIIISKTDLRGKMNWTEIKTTCEYKTAIGAIRETAKKAGLSIAQWELKEFFRR